MRATAVALRALPAVGPKIASLGYCWGGLLSYHAAADDLVDAAVAYYGGGIQNALHRADEIRVPLMLHYGGKDKHIPRDAVDKVVECFHDQPNVEIHLYAEAEHGFNCSHRNTYHQQSAALAHGYSLLFLSQML